MGKISSELIREFTAKGYWGTSGYVARLLAHARERPDAEAIVDSRRRVTFRSLARSADRLAKQFREMGLGAGDVVGVQLPNVAEFHFVRYALSAIGAVTMPIGVVYRKRELLHALGATHAVAVVIPDVLQGTDHVRMIEEIRTSLPDLKHVFVNAADAPAGTVSLPDLFERRGEEPDSLSHLDPNRADPDEPDLFLMSSGTTGLSKIIMVTPNAWLYTGTVTAKILGACANDVVLALPPITGGAGYNNGFGSPCVSGAKIVLQESFEAAAAVQLIVQERVTSVAAVPAQAIKMLEVLEQQYGGRLPGATVRVWLSVGAYLPVRTAQKLEALLGCKVVNIYGAVEAATIAANRLDDPPESRHTSLGRLVDGTQVRLVNETGQEVAAGEVGELLTRLPSMAAGYYGDPQGTETVFGADGWVRTGDCALFDKDGTLRIKGRTKDIISRGAMKISAEEVEDLLRNHPAILDVAVVGMPDPVFGEKSCAYVVLRGGHSVTLDDAIAFLRTKNLATFKLPERLEVVPDLPYSAGLKVQKSVLREDVANKLAIEQGAK